MYLGSTLIHTNLFIYSPEEAASFSSPAIARIVDDCYYHHNSY